MNPTVDLLVGPYDIFYAEPFSLSNGLEIKVNEYKTVISRYGQYSL